MSEYIAKASIEPRDYRVVFLIQETPQAACGVPYISLSYTLDRYSPVRVSILITSPISTNNGT